MFLHACFVGHYRVSQIKNHSWPGASVLLIGNKCDLTGLRKVSTSAARKLADDLGSV